MVQSFGLSVLNVDIAADWTKDLPTTIYGDKTMCDDFFDDNFEDNISDPDNDCEPCINDMQKLLDPILKFNQWSQQMATVNQTLMTYLQNQQANIDRLVGMQGDITSHIHNWNINDLDGGFSSSDPAYIDNWINEELEAYQNRFKKDYPYINNMMDKWIREMESLKRMLEEEASRVEAAVTQALVDGLRTADIAATGEATVSTTEMGAAIAAAI